MEATQEQASSVPTQVPVGEHVEADQTQNQQPDQIPAIPERFQGKSAEEIAKSYLELESTMGKQSNELGELRERTQRYESILAQRQVVQDNAPQQKTPEQVYEEEFAVDPKRAIANYYVNKQAERESVALAQHTRMLYEQAKSGQVQGFEDFASLEPAMAQNAIRYQQLINPAYANSPMALEALYYITKAQTIGAQLRQAKNQGAVEAQTKVTEAKKAFMEPGKGSMGSANGDLKDMSVDDFRKYLDKIEGK